MDDRMVLGDSARKSEIQQFYAGKTIFLTGGTGFVGKLLVEKLLRACWDINKIYLLVRTKKGRTESERFYEIFDAECFKPLKAEHPNFLDKLSLINGDCSLPELGLSEEDKKLIIENVHIVFHVAATVRFDQSLRSAAFINVRATKDLLTMAKKMPKLKGFLYVSTAYSNCPQNEILEEFYPPPIDPENLLAVVNALDDETLTKMKNILLKDYPNTYVYTKAVAESLVANLGRGLPAVMFRPAVVTVSIKEPVPGWIDNIYGVNGVVAGAGLGILRTMPADPEILAELVPVDFVVNGLIAAVWYKATQEASDQKVWIYNYVLSTWHKLQWGRFNQLCYHFGLDYPTTKAVWHYCFALRPNPIMHEIALFFLHTVPAYLIDFILLCLGKDQIAIEGYKKARKFLDVIAYFAQKNWKFGARNVHTLLRNMSEDDKEIFDFDMGKQSVEKMIQVGIVGGRQYLLKDPLDTLPAARRWFFWLKIAHFAFCSIVLLLLLKLCHFIYSCIFS